jgi:chemotaxis protein CheD
MSAGGRSGPVVDVNLAPGDFYFGRRDVRIQTLLGSCVAITMWHPRKHVGGMCHYLLPARSTSKRLSRGYYADDAIALFLEAIGEHGTRPEDYDVKLFGGGNMLPAMGRDGGRDNVSSRNVESGLRLLREHGFRIKTSDVGGARSRKIYLELWNGDVWVQHGRALGARSG